MVTSSPSGCGTETTCADGRARLTPRPGAAQLPGASCARRGRRLPPARCRRPASCSPTTSPTPRTPSPRARRQPDGHRGTTGPAAIAEGGRARGPLRHCARRREPVHQPAALWHYRPAHGRGRWTRCGPPTRSPATAMTLAAPWVLHVDLDQFIAAVEVLRRLTRRPAGRGRWSVTHQARSGRDRVITGAGVRGRSGMLLRRWQRTVNGRWDLPVDKGGLTPPPVEVMQTLRAR